MALTPKLYAQIGEALFGNDWVYRMRELLDIRKPEAEQIAYCAAHGLPYEMPKRIGRPLKAALLAKLDQVQAALDALEAAAEEARAGIISPPPGR